MNLLLILSALMTALTGAFTGARAPQVQVEQVAGRHIAAVRHVSARVRSWLALAEPFPVQVHAAPLMPMVTEVPIYLAKRRE